MRVCPLGRWGQWAPDAPSQEAAGRPQESVHIFSAVGGGRLRRVSTDVARTGLPHVGAREDGAHGACWLSQDPAPCGAGKPRAGTWVCLAPIPTQVVFYINRPRWSPHPLWRGLLSAKDLNQPPVWGLLVFRPHAGLTRPFLPPALSVSRTDATS